MKAIKCGNCGRQIRNDAGWFHSITGWATCGMGIGFFATPASTGEREL